ncbi:hypothetical protein DL762_003666 [Monosporascus cannonballus]|uniref:Uncharacterized protein n=1 Tax=Monosporascus cannonballus TaxID=155416 RepID=A0ABY0HA17_9PEZI|nr:hypothetical protein DL763_006702 [Monosporascus cannonballus]RYO88630.1 hypothetical protein DL762_003666 [Monosporascus cannonballus]
MLDYADIDEGATAANSMGGRSGMLVARINQMRRTTARITSCKTSRSKVISGRFLPHRPKWRSSMLNRTITAQHTDPDPIAGSAGPIIGPPTLNALYPRRIRNGRGIASSVTNERRQHTRHIRLHRRSAALVDPRVPSTVERR